LPLPGLKLHSPALETSLASSRSGCTMAGSHRSRKGAASVVEWAGPDCNIVPRVPARTQHKRRNWSNLYNSSTQTGSHGY
jgi:hypothetical protein